MSGSLHRFFRHPRAQGGSKTAKNSQKWPKMAKNDSIRLPHGNTPQILVFRLNGQQLSQTMDQASYMLTLSNV